jgi:hypothetical protein
MKNNFRILIAVLGAALLYSSCTPDKYELGELTSKAHRQTQTILF